jgi:hypothetical protein
MVDDNQTIIEAYIHADYNMEILGQKWRALTNFLALKKLSNSRLRKIYQLLASELFENNQVSYVLYRSFPPQSLNSVLARIQNTSKKQTAVLRGENPKQKQETHIHHDSSFSQPFFLPTMHAAMREEEEEVQQQTMHAPTNRNTAQYAQRNFRVRSVP